MKDLTPDVINDLIRTYRDRAIEKAMRPVNPYDENPSWEDATRRFEKPSELRTYLEMLNAYKEEARFNAIQGRYDDALEDAEQLCKENNVKYRQNSNEFCELCRGLLFAVVEATEVEMKVLQGDYQDLRGFANRPAPMVPQPAPKPVDEGPLLSEVIKKYVDWQANLPETEKAKWKNEGTKKKHLAALDLFVEFHDDIPIDRIKTPECFTFRDMLCRLPAGRNRLGSPYKGKSLDELMEMDIEDRLMFTTINNYMTFVKLMFKYAIQYGQYKGTNPVVDYRIRDDRSPDEKRDQFSKDELEALFKSPDYLKDTFEKPFQFWVPLIALFHGMRQNEIAQLYLADIKMKDGVQVFSVMQDAPDKKVKNKPSRRLVPIHPFLLDDLKFMDYVEQLRVKGKKRLFPELSFVKDGYGSTVSNWFREYKRAQGIDPPKGAPRKDFHSFRSNFTTRAAELDLPVRKQLYVVGHAMGKDQSSRSYIKGFKADLLLEDVISKIDFHKTLKLDFLKKSQFVVK